MRHQLSAARHRLELLRQMIRIRRFDETCADLLGATRIRGLRRVYGGAEAIAAGATNHLMTTDAVVATLGVYGHGLARGLSMESLLTRIRRGESTRMYDAQRRLYGGDAIVRGLPVAVGAALGDRLRSLPRLTACFFTEDDTSDDELHECMNLAARWQLPLLLGCVTDPPVARPTADWMSRASSSAMPAWSVDGTNVLAVEQATRQAVETIPGWQWTVPAGATHIPIPHPDR